MRKMKLFLASAVLAAGVPSTAIAGWKIMAANQPVAVAKSTLTVTPLSAWNRSSARQSPKGEMWTLDGLALNELSFYAGVAGGETILRDRFKKDKPLPKFNAQMLAPDIVQLYEATVRITLGTSLFEVDTVEPVQLAGQQGVRFTYHYAVQGDDLRRNGEARAAVIGGKLYLITYEAPAIHYYDASIQEAQKIMESARL